MNVVEVGEETATKLVRMHPETFERATARALPEVKQVLGLDATLQLFDAGNMSLRAFEFVKSVLLKSDLHIRTASIAKMKDWGHSFDVPFDILNMDLMAGTKAKATVMPSIVMVWSLTALQERDLDLAFAQPGGWVERNMDFEPSATRFDAVFKWTQDAGDVHSAFCTCLLNQPFTNGAWYVHT